MCIDIIPKASFHQLQQIMKTTVEKITYKDKFREVDDKARYRHIATKIEKEMTVLRSQVEEAATAPRRWVWELIQNAKDVHHDNGVRIQIDQQNHEGIEKIVFRHDGKPFSAENIRFLIEQVSSKNRKKGEDGKNIVTGKFGTGFLSTHLLSEKVTVVGVAKEPELSPRKFEVMLDRSPLHIEGLIDSVKHAKESMEILDDLPEYRDYNEEDFNTEFHYPLEDDQAFSVAEAGLRDLEACLPYSMVFVDELLNVAVTPKNIVYRNTDAYDLTIFGRNDIEEVNIVSIYIEEMGPEGSVEKFTMAILEKGHTSIAIPVSVTDQGIEILPIDDLTPRLFCDFPLIGTENFPFPVIVNNPNFNPTDPRDGIWLTNSTRDPHKAEENKAILNDAIELYFSMLNIAAKEKWDNLHELAKTKPVSSNYKWVKDIWFDTNILTPIRKRLLHIPIVKTEAAGELISILDNNGDYLALFPSSSKKEYRKRIWDLFNNGFAGVIPKESDIEIWKEMVWEKCGKLSTDFLANTIAGRGTIEKLQSQLDVEEIYDWLNEYYHLIKDEASNYDRIVNSKLIFPDQLGNFKKKNALRKDAGNISPGLREILRLLGDDIQAKLMHPQVEEDFQPEGSIDQNYVVKEISSEATRIANNSDLKNKFQSGLKKLLIWMKDNKESARTLFPDLSHRKYILYNEEEVIESMDRAEQLTDLMEEYGADDITDLRDMLEQGIANKASLLPITQEIVSSLGITSIEEWEKALEDIDLAARFSHQSTPTTEMFLFAQAMIEKAKSNIIAHLKNLEAYDLDNMDSSAKTVLSGVIKKGREIHIVVRPAYSGEVIIYYDSERDTLDYTQAELWVDDLKGVRRITLGHILKCAEIIKFPI